MSGEEDDSLSLGRSMHGDLNTSTDSESMGGHLAIQITINRTPPIARPLVVGQLSIPPSSDGKGLAKEGNAPFHGPHPVSSRGAGHYTAKHLRQWHLINGASRICTPASLGKNADP